MADSSRQPVSAIGFVIAATKRDYHIAPHGLRKAFVRRMAEAGCSEDYLAIAYRIDRVRDV